MGSENHCSLCSYGLVSTCDVLRICISAICVCAQEWLTTKKVWDPPCLLLLGQCIQVKSLSELSLALLTPLFHLTQSLHISHSGLIQFSPLSWVSWRTQHYFPVTATCAWGEPLSPYGWCNFTCSSGFQNSSGGSRLRYALWKLSLAISMLAGGSVCTLVHTAPPVLAELPLIAAGNALQANTIIPSLTWHLLMLVCYKEESTVPKIWRWWAVACLCCQSPPPKQTVLAHCTSLLSSIISVVSFLGTRWCQEPSCSCNQYKAFACFVPQWEDASGLVCRLFRNCFSPSPPGAVSQLCLSVTVLAGPGVSSNRGRDLWSGKMSQRWAGMRGGRRRRLSGLWAEFSDRAIHIFSGICSLSGFKEYNF